VHRVVRGWDAIEEEQLHGWMVLVVRLLAGMAYAAGLGILHHRGSSSRFLLSLTVLPY
jgi:hypothetical protein